MSNQQRWVGIDWGTSNVRAWLVAPDGSTAATARSDRGMGTLNPGEYPAVLTNLLAELSILPDSEIDVWVSGMAGARQGWCEAPYMQVPAPLRDLGKSAVSPDDAPANTTVRILPGLSQTGGHEDVMRGEEVQLLGLLALEPEFEGVACMPGTHCKWVDIRDGNVVRFATAMTGEIYALLSEHSVLRHSLAGETEGPKLEAGITEGLSAGLANPALLTANLFRTRAASLLSDKTADWCNGYLSGLLVGSEVGAHRDWIGTPPVALLGSARLARLYASALGKLDVDSATYDAESATLAGLRAARENFHAG